MKIIDMVNPFVGTETCSLDFPDELTKKWFFLKAQVGNTHPGACYPFGMVSACAYTGGYPTGYSRYMPNSHAIPYAFSTKTLVNGFTHFQASGTGSIGEYYNFLRVTPHSALLRRQPFYRAVNETAKPGYYSATLKEIDCKCELTVNKSAALHRYTFQNKGIISIKLNSHGLRKFFQRIKESTISVKDVEVFAKSFSCKLEFCYTSMYAAVTFDNAKVAIHAGNYVDLEATDKVVSIAVAFSTESRETAIRRASATLEDGFEKTLADTQNAWENKLSAINVDCDDPAVFYTALYHSLIKPCRLDNEKMLGKLTAFDYATLWDMYKTQLPLIYSLYPDDGAAFLNNLLYSKELFGFFPTAILLSRDSTICDKQSKFLAAYAITEGYFRGVPNVDFNRALDLLLSELPILLDEQNILACNEKRYTYLLDFSEGCRSAALMAKGLGRENDSDTFEKAAEQAYTFFDESGFLHRDGNYYEGTYKNHSLHLMHDMDRRIAEAGGRENFAKELDDFFGFPGKECKQMKYFFVIRKERTGIALNRFEGFNNETDMETPVNYLFVGQPDKTYEINKSGAKLFTNTKNGLPGNDDSGALSSCYVWNMLGVFPLPGQNRTSLVTPLVRSATLRLSDGKSLKITNKADGASKRVLFNGKEIESRLLPMNEFNEGGELIFE